MMKKFKNSKPASPPLGAQPKSSKVNTEPQAPKPQQLKIVSAGPTLAKPGRVDFELVKPGAKQVCVAGSFNDWRPDTTPLAPADNGRWVGDLTIEPGRYEYLFVVDGQWLPDPNAKESVQNPFGGRNSVIGVSG
jgi:1,4-alpha-glucan branching enzyme